MKIHIIQHVDFEGPGTILDWAQAQGHEIAMLYPEQLQNYPEPGETDLVIILGGNFDLENKNLEWLNKEKIALKKFIDAKTSILGICGGAQLLTVVLGGRVFRNSESEIGWHNIELTSEAGIFKNIQNSLAFHWHSDTFGLPEGATPLASSVATKNQGYLFGKNIIAVQFHPEINKSGVEQLISKFGELIKKDRPYQQDVKKINELLPSGEAQSKALLTSLLNYIEEQWRRGKA